MTLPALMPFGLLIALAAVHSVVYLVTQCGDTLVNGSGCQNSSGRCPASGEQAVAAADRRLDRLAGNEGAGSSAAARDASSGRIGSCQERQQAGGFGQHAAAHGVDVAAPAGGGDDESDVAKGLEVMADQGLG